MTEIEEAAFILRIPTKIARANDIAFIEAIFGRGGTGSSLRHSLWHAEVPEARQRFDGRQAHCHGRRDLPVGPRTTTCWKHASQQKIALGELMTGTTQRCFAMAGKRKTVIKICARDSPAYSGP